jgi:RNA polymerase sigma-70 factor (ECF subfamily)
MPDESALISRAQRGNLESFNRLVLMHQDSAFTVAFRLMGDSHRAADAAQDAFIAAYRKLDSYRGGNFRAWLLRIVTNRCYDLLRKDERHPHLSIERAGDDDDPEPLEIPDATATPEEIAQQRELQRAVQGCISALGDDQRMALVLSDIEGMSYDEIAAQTGAAMGTVKSRISRARASVRDCLQGVRELLPLGYRLKGNGI